MAFHKEIYLPEYRSKLHNKLYESAIIQALRHQSGGGTFIGMKCYLDDLCCDKIEIGSNAVVSYGVYFACHGRKQDHHRIIIKNGAYIGMRASIVAPKDDVEIGEGAIVGAMTLVNKTIPARTTAVGVPCRIIENKK